MLGNLSKKLEAKFPSTAILPVDASPVEGQQLQQKEVRYQIV